VSVAQRRSGVQAQAATAQADGPAAYRVHRSGEREQRLALRPWAMFEAARVKAPLAGKGVLQAGGNRIEPVQWSQMIQSHRRHGK